MAGRFGGALNDDGVLQMKALVPRLPSYRLDCALFGIVATEFRCMPDKACNVCSVGQQLTQRPMLYDAKPDCDAVRQRRIGRMRQLAEKIYSDVLAGRIQPCNETLDRVVPPPSQTTPLALTLERLLNWLGSTFVSLQEFETICAREGIEIVAEDAEKQMTAQRASQDVSANSCDAANQDNPGGIDEIVATTTPSTAKETPQERRIRVRNRKAELIGQGVRKYNVVIALEENISPSRVKQLVSVPSSER